MNTHAPTTSPSAIPGVFRAGAVAYLHTLQMTVCKHRNSHAQ